MIYIFEGWKNPVGYAKKAPASAGAFCWRRWWIFSRGLSNSNGLRLLIFPQPLGRALKNQNAAPTTPPCFCHRQRSSSLHWADCLRSADRRPVLILTILAAKKAPARAGAFCWRRWWDSNPRARLRTKRFRVVLVTTASIHLQNKPYTV